MYGHQCCTTNCRNHFLNFNTYMQELLPALPVSVHIHSHDPSWNVRMTSIYHVLLARLSIGGLSGIVRAIQEGVGVGLGWSDMVGCCFVSLLRSACICVNVFLIASLCVFFPSARMPPISHLSKCGAVAGMDFGRLPDLSFGPLFDADGPALGSPAPSSLALASRVACMDAPGPSNSMMKELLSETLLSFCFGAFLGLSSPLCFNRTHNTSLFSG